MKQLVTDTTFLDHAGTTLYAKAFMEQFSQDMVSNLFGNPHSSSPSSQLTTRRVDDVRLRVLRFFKADPELFDVVFVANATAGIKLVMDAFRDYGQGDGKSNERKGFWFGYHGDSHTSIVGVRESAQGGHHCFAHDDEVEAWLSQTGPCDHRPLPKDGQLALFAYPAQSNMNGRRLPRDWSFRLRESAPGRDGGLYCLLDAAALVSTAPLDLGDSWKAPDFTVLSFYKIFGFPDLGALIVRKESGAVLERRRYFGGGTVDAVVNTDTTWHAKKSQSLHDGLEDGTIPFHSILALQAALDIHERLYGSMDHITRHTTSLAKAAYEKLSSLRHSNGGRVCEIYNGKQSTFGDSRTQGPIVAFNIRNSSGEWIGKSLVEDLATIRDIHLRTGGMCNPGGIASNLGLTSQEVERNYVAGQRCGDDHDIMSGKPNGVVRVSFGAMSSMRDVDILVEFIREFFVDATSAGSIRGPQGTPDPTFVVESLTVYPIKSCSGWKVPHGEAWPVYEEGLAWDREWCLVHLGTGAALSQKQHPKMALIRPSIDTEGGDLRVRAGSGSGGLVQEVVIPLHRNSGRAFTVKEQASRVCGDDLIAQTYTSPEIANFFTSALGVACTLARFPAGGMGRSRRHAKAHLQTEHAKEATRRSMEHTRVLLDPPILLSNESPVLVVCRSSLNRLNEAIKETGGKAARAEVFRANIVVAELGAERPFVEDKWRYMKVGKEVFQVRMDNLRQLSVLRR
ncbi:MAG: hypothetical protein M1832_005612 [Thelocarpon impressellum]|nr:MAG: hypothetical protein M1832_005612 [Thelocarpon impressellum]